ARLHRPADDLDAADLDKIRLCGDPVPAAMVARRADNGELPEVARSAEQRRAGLPALFLEQPFRVLRHHGARGAGGGPCGLRLFAVPLPGPQVPVLLGAPEEHVPRRDFPRAALYPDARAGAGEYAWIADPDLSHLRPAA